MKQLHLALGGLVLFGLCLQGSAAETNSLRVRVSFGQRETKRTTYSVRLRPGSPGVKVSAMRGVALEADDVVNDRAVLHAGAGDVRAIECDVTMPALKPPPRRIHETWEHLLKNTTFDAAQRLRDDPAMRHDSPMLTIELSEDGTRGFSIGLEQLLKHKAMWFPESDVFVTLADAPVGFAAHLASLSGQRLLDRVEREPEATYAQYTACWEDMGSPTYKNPHSIPPGHIVGVGWDSALYKFGIDRFAEVRNDYGKADVFHFRFALANAAKAWRGQKLADGLPLVTSTFEEAGLRYEIEQFAAPLLGPPTDAPWRHPDCNAAKGHVTRVGGKGALRVPRDATRCASVPAPSRSAKKAVPWCLGTAPPPGSASRARVWR